MNKILVTLLALTATASLAGNVFLYNRYSTARPVMSIGPEAISKKDYQDLLEYRSGKSVLQELAFNKIINQAAQKAGVKVTSQQLDERLREIERRAPETLVQAKASPASMEAFRRLLQSKLMVEELRLKGVNASASEVADFYKRNAGAFTLPAQAQATVVVAQNSVDASTASELLKQNMRPDIIAQQPRLAVIGDNRYNRDWRQLGNAGPVLNKMMFGKKKGDIITAQTAGRFFIARINSISGGGLPPLEKNRELVTRLARLAKAPTEPLTLAKLYRDGNVRFEVSRYANYFADVEALAKQGGKQVAANR